MEKKYLLNHYKLYLSSIRMMKTISLVCLKAGSKATAPCSNTLCSCFSNPPHSCRGKWRAASVPTPSNCQPWIMQGFILFRVNVSGVEDIKVSSNVAHPQCLHRGMLCPRPPSLMLLALFGQCYLPRATADPDVDSHRSSFCSELIVIKI